MEKQNIAVIGVGYLGKFHAEKYAKIPEVSLVGVVDSDYKRAQEIASQLGTKAYADYRELLGKVHAVSIVVPTPLHYAIARDFLCHNTDILLEKPMTTTLEEADELIHLANDKACIIQVGHLERFNPAVVALQNIITEPMFIESHRIGVYKERGTDVSVVLDLMIHDIDIILNFVCSDIKTIHAAGIPVISDHVDIANARLEFVNGCVANVTASRISVKNERKIRLFQKDAYISVNFANQEIMVISKDPQGNSLPIPGMRMQQLSFGKEDVLEDEIKAFVESVKTRRSPLVTGIVGRAALNIALSVMDQIKQSSKQFGIDMKDDR
ncbi:MAG: Gfo/Idh/MocA family oxidoreductase [Desulfobacterales bacterium]|nr:Gfo/Idh/MocA family oxidoreductase [Desulfobacterales bacterium]